MVWSVAAGNEPAAARIIHSVTVGLIVCVAVLAGATAFGIGWRRRNGVLRPVARAGIPGQPRSRGRRAGRTARRPDGRRARTLTEVQLMQPLGSRATLVQFSSAYCAPCHAARRILAEVAAMSKGVAHIEIDAESRLGLARELGIMSTPAIFVLDRHGTIMAQGTGLPRKADVIAAAGLTVPEDTPGASSTSAAHGTSSAGGAGGAVG